MGGRGQRDHARHGGRLAGHELRPVQGLEAALGVPDQIDLRGAGRGEDPADEGGDLGGGLGDRRDPADRDTGNGLTVGGRVGAEARGGQRGAESGKVAGTVAAEAVQEHDGLGMSGGRPAAPVVEPGAGPGGRLPGGLTGHHEREAGGGGED